MNYRVHFSVPFVVVVIIIFAMAYAHGYTGEDTTGAPSYRLGRGGNA